MNKKSNVDSQIERSLYLMGYESPLKESKQKNVSSGIEFYQKGADNKVYGIIKEGNTYYIKSTNPGSETLKESYEHLSGYNYRNENGYKSYNEASKQLELKLMSLNEACNGKCNTSTVDFNRGKKILAELTESARKELNRVHQIFENSGTIGMNNIGDPEGKNKATDPTKQGEPFENNVTASLDKDPKFNGTVKGATDGKEVKDTDKKLQNADKMEKGPRGDEGYTKVKSDLKGDINESMFEGCCDEVEDLEEPIEPLENDDMDIVLDDEDLADDDVNNEDIEGMPEEEDEDLVGLEGEDPMEELTEAIENFEKAMNNEDDVVLKGRQFIGKKMQSTETMKRLSEKIDKVSAQMAHDLFEGRMSANEIDDEMDKEDRGETYKANRKKNNNYSTRKMKCAMEENLQTVIDHMVQEEVTRLNVWGQHPSYRKQPMSTPKATEVLRGSARGDWNDESAKSDAPYGSKIGSGAPFEKQVGKITDSVLQTIRENLRKPSKKA